MTREEFEKGYASRSGCTVEQLHSWGRFAEPCSCGTTGCNGWQMGHQHEDALWEDSMRSVLGATGGGHTHSFTYRKPTGRLQKAWAWLKGGVVNG